MGAEAKTVYSPVAPFLHPRTPDDSQGGLIEAGNGAVTASVSIRERRVAAHMDVCDAYEQVERFDAALGWGW